MVLKASLWVAFSTHACFSRPFWPTATASTRSTGHFGPCLTNVDTALRWHAKSACMHECMECIPATVSGYEKFYFSFATFMLHEAILNRTSLEVTCKLSLTSVRFTFLYSHFREEIWAEKRYTRVRISISDRLSPSITIWLKAQSLAEQ